jgi:hypothetical protein
MAARMRIWHPDHPPGFLERALDLFVGVVPEPLPEGVEPGLVAAQQTRVVRAFLDGCFSVVHLGHEMVRAESTWTMPAAPEARRACAEALALRLRFGQVHAGGSRVTLSARWFEFHDVPHGVRALVRLTEPPAPHLRSFLAANLGTDPMGPWTELAVGAEG